MKLESAPSPSNYIAFDSLTEAQAQRIELPYFADFFWERFVSRPVFVDVAEEWGRHLGKYTSL